MIDPRKRTGWGGAAVVAALVLAAGSAAATPAGYQQSYIPGRVGVRGTVPNPGTQQQELTNLTLPAPYNVFEFTVTCAACHGGSVDQQVAHFGVQGGTPMASAARDPVFRANQIATNNILRAISGEDGAGNTCFRCHSPNGWYSGRFDPTLGGDAEGRTMMHSIVASTDDEGISCEQCHRAVGAVQYKKPGLDPAAKVWNLLAGIGGYPADPGWSHDGHAFVDQAGDPTLHPGAPYGDTSLQYSDGMMYSGPYSGTVAPSFSDVPAAAWAATDYTGQIFAVYPPGDPRQGQPVVNVDGSVAATYDQPISAPIDWAKSNFTTNPPTIVYDYQAQAMSLEHPTAASRFLMTSEFCGSCHDLTVPVLNHGMPEQRTYTEWKFSAYAKPGAGAALGIPVATERTAAGEVRCQDCHMPKMRHEYADNAPSTVNADPVLVGWFPYAKDRNPTGGTSKHVHAGANRDLGAMMKFLYPQPDLEMIGAPTGADVRVFPGMLSTRDPMYDRNVRNAELTMADGVGVEIASGPAATATPGVYEVKVKVTNRTGHRIPSGYPDGRRMWISLDVKDASGASVYRSGVYDAAQARLTTDGTSPLNRALSPLVDATVANAVMVYERVTCRDGLVAGPPLNDGAPDGICEDEGTPLLLNNRIMFDNRIPPAGFSYADYRTGGVKFWSYDWAPNPNAGGALRPVPCEDAPGYGAPPSGFGGSCAAATAQRYPDGQGYDLVTYRFAAASAPVSARAEIDWQTHTREYMEHLRDQQENLGLTDTVRPEGPLDPMMTGYPLTPSYLSDVIGLASIADPYRPGVPLRDNWGGVAYAAWLATGKGAPAVVAAADTAVAQPPAAPAAPGVTATPGMPYEATVSWPAVAGADGYVVWILYGCPTRAKLPDGTLQQGHCYDPALDVDATGLPLPEVSTVGTSTAWDRLAIVRAETCTGGTCALVNTAMNVNKTYGFKVAAFNAAGLGPESPITTNRTPWDIPLPPDLLKLVSITSTTATLAWTDTADNETIFVVQLVPVAAPQPPLAPTLTPTANGTGVLPPAAPEQVFVFTTQTPGLNGFGGNQDTLSLLTPNTAYDVQVQACNAVACSGMNTNGPIQIRTLAALVAPTLAAPTTSTSPLSVGLAWSASAGAADYLVERSTDGGATWTALPAVTTTSLTDTGVTPTTTYAYRVTARNGTSLSPPSNVQTVTTPALLAPPGTPTATGPTATRKVTVAWTYTNQGQTGFRVERLDANGASAVVAPNLAASLRSFVDTLPALPATQGTAATYTYTVTALQGALASTSPPSLPVKLLPARPAAPTSLAVTAGAPLSASFTVRWQDNAVNELGFTVERQVRRRANLATCSGTWSAYTTSTLAQQPAVAGAGASASVTDGGLNGGACYQYRYRVRALNDGGTSAWTAYSTPASAP